MEALRILLIEPDRYARDILKLLVEAAYTGVIIATSRSAADGMMMLQETRYDIVICDDSPDAAPLLNHLSRGADSSLVLMTADTRLNRSTLQIMHPHLSVQSLLYKPIMFRDFCQNLHKAVLSARSRQARTSRRRSGRLLPPSGVRSSTLFRFSPLPLPAAVSNKLLGFACPRP